MPKIITYALLKPQVKAYHQIVYGGEFYSLASFKSHCFRAKVWEYPEGAVQLYDTRSKTYSDPEYSDDPTPEQTPDGMPAADGDGPADPDLTAPDAPAMPPPDFSNPPPDFVPGPLPVLQ
ncbi:hypothetical protein [Fibrella aquatilis]|uniref:Uncharacterized protein n=1 Tax=Fibrella aquatilis TaxID=2817059 RepID=A0A939JZM4_9BACT|nr:hypothetical protein [Fibrella aquatilis]MBO0930340.1 hypothetical protein [Fibrella aquatilis]